MNAGLERPSLTTERGCIQHGWHLTDRVCLYVNADAPLVDVHAILLHERRHQYRHRSQGWVTTSWSS